MCRCNAVACALYTTSGCGQFQFSKFLPKAIGTMRQSGAEMNNEVKSRSLSVAEGHNSLTVAVDMRLENMITATAKSMIKSLHDGLRSQEAGPSAEKQHRQLQRLNPHGAGHLGRARRKLEA